MDDILFRQMMAATPNDQSDDFLARVANSESDKTLLNAAKAFDEKVTEALSVELPVGMLDKLLLTPSLVIEKERIVNGRWHIAIAASIAFIIGVSLPLLNNISPAVLNIGEIAMQHIQEDASFIAQSDERADINIINAKLVRYGAKAHTEIGQVNYVNYCSFEGTPALHMALKGKKGQITIFVVPASANFVTAKTFENKYLSGITERMGQTDVVIVGEKGEPLQPIREAMLNNIHWAI